MNAPQQEVLGGSKEEVWGGNGRRVVVVEGKQGFVQVGSDVVKIVVLPKPPTAAQKKAAFLKRLDKQCHHRVLSVKKELEIMNQYLAEKQRGEAIRNEQPTAVVS